LSRGILIVKPTQNVGRRIRKVVLNEVSLDARFVIARLPVELDEVTAMVPMNAGLDHEYAGERS
jgi:hypothetical protein